MTETTRNKERRSDEGRDVTTLLIEEENQLLIQEKGLTLENKLQPSNSPHSRQDIILRRLFDATCLTTELMTKQKQFLSKSGRKLSHFSAVLVGSFSSHGNSCPQKQSLTKSRLCIPRKQDCQANNNSLQLLEKSEGNFLGTSCLKSNEAARRMGFEKKRKNSTDFEDELLIQLIAGTAGNQGNERRKCRKKMSIGCPPPSLQRRPILKSRRTSRSQ